MATINAPEKILQGAGQLVQLVEALFSRDMEAGVAPTDPNAVPGGLLADLVSQLGRVGTDFSVVLDSIKQHMDGNLVDDKKSDVSLSSGLE